MIEFLDNKYTKIYFQLIEKRKRDVLFKKDVYCECHHIIPKSLGGSNDEDNMVNLLPREHFVAHLLLTKMTIGEAYIKMCWAIHRMAFSKINYFGSRDYEWFRKKHSDFLINNHPSKKKSWRDAVSKRVSEDWENNEERRQNMSNMFKKLWTDEKYREKMTEINRKRSYLGGKASKEVMAKRLEYKGKVYIGYNELTRETGISKRLYKKYYLNGIDPSFRVGKDGPTSVDDIKQIIVWFCESQNISIPKDQENIDKILKKMYDVGVLSKSELQRYKRKENQ